MLRYRSGGVVAASLALAASAEAQIGTGWTRYYPTSIIDTECGDVHTNHGDPASLSYKGVRFTNSGGVETYQLLDTSCNRVERRSDVHYRSGRRQWETTLRIHAPTNQFLMQIFAGGGVGMYWSLRARNSISGGGIRVGTTVVASNVYGKWLRFNVIHDMDSRVMRCYVDGSLKWSGGAAAPADYGYNVKT